MDACGTPDKVDRFTAAKALIEKWYGGAPTDSSNTNGYSDTGTPTAWSGEDALYRNGFARFCRTCHIAHWII